MKTKRILALMLAVALVLAMTMSGCGGNTTSSTTSTTTTSSTAESSEVSEPADEDVGYREVDEEAYWDESDEIYDNVLGEFWELYEPASAELDDIGLRYTEMALAEAKLLEAAILYPNQSGGGNYAMRNYAPYSFPYATSGSDGSKYYKALVTTDHVKAEDYNELKAQWYELKGTGTYTQYVKDYFAEHGYTLKDTFTDSFTSGPETWDALNSYKAVDSQVIIQTCDGLVEHDNEGTLQPALAESWEVSDDGLTYTFHIRQGVKWVDQQGREIGELTAKDFVSAMQHVLDCCGGLEYLVDGLIVNATEYINREITDFSEVGVKAVDDYTLEYTLTKKAHYFMGMLTYVIFYPLPTDYYVSLGGLFGAEYDESDNGAGSYGLGPDSIAYCGPFLVTNFTDKNTMVFEANPTYYNADKQEIKTLTWLYNDGSDPTKGYNDYKAGTVDYVTLSSATLETAKTEGLFDDYAIITDTDTGSYPTFFNLNRYAFANANDDTKVVSSQTPEDAARTHSAMQNVHFRRALATSVDRVAYKTQQTGTAETASLSLMNSYVPWNFVSLPNEVTVSINGTETTFPEGTWYGEIIQAQLDADGVPIKAYDPDADNGNGAGAGYDGWYNPEYSASELAIAVEELAAEGVEVSAENPIMIDYPVVTSNSAYKNRAEALRQSVEEVTGGLIQICITVCADSTEWQNTGYATQNGYEANYDICDLSGWGPDYDDPSTYLDTLYPEGSMARNCGIY